MSFWQPMKMAPMDGTEILLKTRRGIVSAWFYSEPGTPGSDDGAYDWICYDDEFQIDGHDPGIEAWAPIEGDIIPEGYSVDQQAYIFAEDDMEIIRSAAGQKLS